MKLSTDFLQRFIEERHGWQTCAEYGEPGYSIDVEGGFVVLGSYWLPNDHPKLNRDQRIVSWDGLHPRIWAQMEAQGIQFEWSDEWVIDHDNSKCYRSTGDSYQWQPSYTYNDNGDILTPDDDLSDWIDWADCNPSRCLFSGMFTEAQMVEAGWTKFNEDQYEHGFHPGMTDTPQQVETAIKAAHGDDVCYVFMLDENSQFYSKFSAYYRLKAELCECGHDITSHEEPPSSKCSECVCSMYYHDTTQETTYREFVPSDDWKID